METTLSERIKILAKRVAGNPSRLCKAIGMAQPTINGYINKGSEPGTVFYLKVAGRYPEVSLDWLITGRGEMLRPDAPSVPATIPQVEQVAELERCQQERDHLNNTVALYQQHVRMQERVIQLLEAGHVPVLASTPKGLNSLLSTVLHQQNSHHLTPHYHQQTHP